MMNDQIANQLKNNAANPKVVQQIAQRYQLTPQDVDSVLKGGNATPLPAGPEAMVPAAPAAPDVMAPEAPGDVPPSAGSTGGTAAGPIAGSPAPAKPPGAPTGAPAMPMGAAPSASGTAVVEPKPPGNPDPNAGMPKPAAPPPLAKPAMMASGSQVVGQQPPVGPQDAKLGLQKLMDLLGKDLTPEERAQAEQAFLHGYQKGKKP